MSGDPPEGVTPPATPKLPPGGTAAALADLGGGDGAHTQRTPLAGESDGPPEIERFLSPPPPPPDGTPPSTPGAIARRRSRRTVRNLSDSVPPRPAAANPPATSADGDPQPLAAVDSGWTASSAAESRVHPATVARAPSDSKPPSSDKAKTIPRIAPSIPPAPPVPTMPATRNAPTLRTVPRPAMKSGLIPATAVPVAPAAPPVPVAPVAPAAGLDAPKPAFAADAVARKRNADTTPEDGWDDNARTQEMAAPEPEPTEVFEVIRPMRIISIGMDPTPDISVSTPAADAAAQALTGQTAQSADGLSPSSLPSSLPITDRDRPLPPPVPSGPKPPKPPVVEEVEAIEEAVEEEDASATPRTEDLEPVSGDDEPERISDVEIAAHADAEHDPDEVKVDFEELTPKKPPPPPPKRPVSIEPPPNTDPKAAAPVVQATPTLDLSARKRQKPWWEEVFSDDYIRTMEKLDRKVVRKECDFIEDRLGLEKGAVMLDLACGSGAHAVELATRGYNVVGYDLSLAMLALAQDEAQERGQKINFLQGDMREMAFEEAFDGIYSWSTSFGYFEDEKNVNVLSRVHRALRQGGMFLLDIANRDYVCPRQPSLVWFEGDECVCMDEMHVDFFTSRLKVKRTVLFEDGRSRECEYAIRLYGLHELGKMLHETGFKVVEVTGHPAHPGVFFGSESPRIIILAERA